MICASCQTPLPEEAIACWKCGRLVVPAAPAATAAKRPVDLLLVVIALLISVAVFVCLGWAVPFTVWGLITTAGKQYPEWSGAFSIISGAAFILSGLGFFGGTWWGGYKFLERLTSPTAPSAATGGDRGARQADARASAGNDARGEPASSPESQSHPQGSFATEKNSPPRSNQDGTDYAL